MDLYKGNVFEFIMHNGRLARVSDWQMASGPNEPLMKCPPPPVITKLDPAKIKTTAEKGVEDGALKGIIKLFPQISKDQVKLELFSLASKFDVLNLLLNNGENMDPTYNNCKICSTCPSCVLKILASNRLHDKAYDKPCTLHTISYPSVI